MRRILVDSARARGNEKRRGDVVKVSFDEALLVYGEARFSIREAVAIEELRGEQPHDA